MDRFCSKKQGEMSTNEKRREWCMHATTCKRWHGLFWQVDPRKRQVKVTSCLHLVEPNFNPKIPPNGRPFKGLFSQKFFSFVPKKDSSLQCKSWLKNLHKHFILLPHKLSSQTLTLQPPPSSKQKEGSPFYSPSPTPLKHPLLPFSSSKEHRHQDRRSVRRSQRTFCQR